MTKHLTVALLTCLLVLIPMPTYADELLDSRAVKESKDVPQDTAARIAELETQLNLLKAQQALLLNTTTQQTEALKAQKDLINAQTDLLKSQVDQAKLLIPTTTQGLAGTVSGDPSAARGTVQAWNELDTAFGEVATAVHRKFGDHCALILNPPSLDDYIYSKWVTESLTLVSKQLPDRIQGLEKSTPPELLPKTTAAPTLTVSPLVIPSLVGPLIDSIIGFTKLFRSDSTFSSVAVTPSADSISAVAASKLLAADCRVIDFEHLPVPDATFDQEFTTSDLYRALDAVSGKLNEIDVTYNIVAGNTKRIEADPHSDKTMFPLYDAALARWKDLSESLHKALDPIVSIPATASDSVVVKLLKGAMMDHLLTKQNARLMYLKVEAIGGNRVIKKNVWRSDREYESSSYIITYKIVEKTGEVMLAGKLAKNSAFQPMPLP